MLDTFLATLSPMMVMFICILVGFILRKCKAAPENTGSVLSKLVMSVFLPAQALDAFMRNCTFESIASQYQVVLYGAVAIVISLVIGIPLSCLFSKAGMYTNIGEKEKAIAQYEGILQWLEAHGYNMELEGAYPRGMIEKLKKTK